LLSVAVGAVALLAPSVTADAASSWAVGVGTSSGALARSDTTPVAPTITVTCDQGLNKTLHASWTATAHSTFDLYRSANGAGYTLIAAGLTGSTYQDTALANASYTYEVRAKVSANWISPLSAPSTARTIQGNGCS
jgi:hypothetical protein